MRVRLMAIAFLLAGTFVLPAHANSTWFANFEAAYPAAVGTRIDDCTMCHTVSGQSARNSYGAAYKTAGHNFKTIESADSDGDGFTNLAEITALTFPGNSADKPAVTTGSLTVTILPAGANTAGAQWRAGATGTYQNSGVTVTGLAVGSITVQFKAVTGWTTPADQNVTITAGGTATATGTYVQLSLVPNVVGQTQAAASTAITGAGLTVGTITQAFSATVPSGTVISQSPTSGGYVTPGSAVALTVSKGPQPVTVPNVVGLTQAAASTAITGAGLTVGAITQAYSATVPSGSVISQTPSAGGSALPGAAVALTVSQGPQPVTVPNVVGLTQAAASTAITGAGLTVGAITQAYSGTVPSGSVISQTPVAGGSVAPGTAVALTVSQGPQSVTVPNVVGQPQATASTLIVGANLVVGTISQQYSATVPTGTVISQTPTGGSSADSGSAVLLTVSKGVEPVVTGSIMINGGASSTNSTNVTLSLTWSSNAVRMRFSDNGANWTLWEPLQATRAYTLPAGEGYKTVRVQFLDIADNRSPGYGDYILLDTVPPTGSIAINNGAPATTSLSVTLSLNWSDAGSGVRWMRFSDNGSNWTLWERVAATKAYTLPGPVGYNTVRVQYKDGAGNLSSVFRDYILVQGI